MANSNIILTNKMELSFTGDAAKGDGYYGYNDGLHTASFHVSNFLGRLWLEASIAENPTANDWFPIQLTATHHYIEYFSQTTETKGITFTGNFVWVRARVDRSHLTATSYNVTQHGRLEKVVLVI